MNSDANIGTVEKILLIEILWHHDSILEALGVTNSDSEAKSVSGTMEEQIMISGGGDDALHAGISSDTLSGTGDSLTT
jgi:hypothetical protein